MHWNDGVNNPDSTSLATLDPAAAGMCAGESEIVPANAVLTVQLTSDQQRGIARGVA